MARSYIVYKVVYSLPALGVYTSVMMVGSLQLRYHLGVKTKAEIGELYCFRDKRAAIRWVKSAKSSDSDFRILQCKSDYKPTKATQVGPWHCVQDCIKFWTLPKDMVNEFEFKRKAPAGSYTVKSLVPLREIAYE